MPAESPQPTKPSPQCPVCGREGRYRFRELRDFLFGSSGSWHMRQCINTLCGALWLDPAPREELLPELYKNYYTHADRVVTQTTLRRVYERVRSVYLHDKYDYRNDEPAWLRVMFRMMAKFLPARRDYFDFAACHISYIPSGRLLEIGCGSGAQLADLARRGWLVTGLDVDPEAVRQAVAKGIDVRTGTLDENIFPEEYFDVIVMMHVIEHVLQPQMLMAQCMAVLKPGGQMVIVTPNAKSFGAVLFGQDWRGLEPPRHIQILTTSAAILLTKTAGFVLERCFTTQRDARNILHKSFKIRHARTGRRYLPDWAFRVTGWIAETIGRLILVVRPQSGEELCLIVSKPCGEGR